MLLPMPISRFLRCTLLALSLGLLAAPYASGQVGDSTRFKRQDSIEETWRVCGPLIEKPPRIHPYKPGTWGPKAADKLVADYGGWHEPWTGS